MDIFPRPDTFALLKRFFGFLFILAGLALAMWILALAYHLIYGGTELALISLISLSNEHDRVFLMPSGKFVIPEHVFLVFGYFAAIALLGVLAGLAKALLKLGVQLIQPEWQEVLKKLTKALPEQIKTNLGKSIPPPP